MTRKLHKSAPQYARLLHGPYKTPKLRIGDRATCLFRDCDVIITGWHDARISWPRNRGERLCTDGVQAKVRFTTGGKLLEYG
jgi:hypothetical protein